MIFTLHRTINPDRSIDPVTIPATIALCVIQGSLGGSSTTMGLGGRGGGPAVVDGTVVEEGMEEDPGWVDAGIMPPPLTPPPLSSDLPSPSLALSLATLTSASVKPLPSKKAFFFSHGAEMTLGDCKNWTPLLTMSSLVGGGEEGREEEAEEEGEPLSNSAGASEEEVEGGSLTVTGPLDVVISKGEVVLVSREEGGLDGEG